MLKYLLVPMTMALAVATMTTADAQRGGTAKEQEACSRDASRFCRKLLDQGDFTILACLKENRSKLTKACNQVLISNGQ